MTIVTTPIPNISQGNSTDAPFSVKDKVIWVTGASKGIGAAIARGLAAGGAHLLLQARSGDHLAALRNELREGGAQVETVMGSVTDPAAVAESVDRAQKTWGRVDGLVACAGVSPIYKRAELIDVEEWRDVIDTNLTGTFLAATAAGRHMLENGSGSIVIVSSVHGTVGASKLSAYAASKGAVNLLAKSLASEWADRNVRVNVIAPGYVETDMTSALREHHSHGPRLLSRVPMGRFAAPNEMAGAVQFLLSEAASYMTGAVLEIDGGWTSQ